LIQAQDADSLYTLPSDSPLSFGDSLSIFQLIDSLLLLEESMPGSQLAIRLGYNSNVLSAGRTLGIEQFGLSPGVSFYHTSGLYADVSSYWSNNFDPAYYQTIVTAGYMHVFNKVLSASINYDRYFYNSSMDESVIQFKNTITVSPNIEVGAFSLRADYSYYFGNKDAHRIMPSLSATLMKKKFLGIDRISLIPTAYMLLGTESSSNIEIVNPRTLVERLKNIRDYGTPYKIITHENTVFGVMNYAFSVPLFITYKNWNFNVAYTYNIPVALSVEFEVPPKSGYVSAGITCFINLKRNKLSL
jgi:hypothetical protein